MMMLLKREKKKAENEQVLHQALSSCMGLCGSLHGDHEVGYHHHQLNAQIYSKTEMMVLFAKGKKS
jgi:hypothetical protein